MRILGQIFVYIGIACFVTKVFSPEYVDPQGIISESFYFIPIGVLFFFVGAIFLLWNKFKVK